jgi:hypothetical protein
VGASLRWSVVGLVGILVPLVAFQKTSLITLKAANGTLEGDFTRIGSVRELDDGRVLLADRPHEGHRRILVGDFAAQSIEQVGRNGRGPGEYDYVGDLVPLPGDSTVMVDYLYRRWHILHKAAIVSLVNSDAKIFQLPRVRSAAHIEGADVSGHVLAHLGPRSIATKPGPNDSTALVRIHRKTGKADTIARMPPPPWQPAR